MENREEFISILNEAKIKGASDIHLIVGLKPTIRVNGELLKLMDYDTVTSEFIRLSIAPYLLEHDWDEFEIERELDFAFSAEGISRYRANLHLEMDNLSLALRSLSTEIPNISSLKLPTVVESFSNFPNGLVLVTGATGSGKSTTLAALVDKINMNRAENIVTIEDPIEYVYEKKKSLIRQREVGRDTPSFSRALKGVLRQDPDVILVGELRDLPSIESALTAAETGHLVFGTLHTNGAAETINRIVDVFPENKQQQIKVQLAATLRAVVSQDLIKSLKGGRVVATEIMISNNAISNLIINSKTNQIASVIETGKSVGMVTMDESLKRLFETGFISKEDYEKRAGKYVL